MENEKTQYDLPLNRMGKLVNDLLEQCETIKLGEGIRRNDVGMFDSLFSNAIKLKTFIENSKDTKDESLYEAAQAIRRRREEVLLEGKKKVQK